MHQYYLVLQLDNQSKQNHRLSKIDSYQDIECVNISRIYTCTYLLVLAQISMLAWGRRANRVP